MEGGRGMRLLEAHNVKLVGGAKGGQEEVVVLAHGFGGNQTTWDYLLPSLASCYRVLLFDLRCSGSTDPTAFEGGFDSFYPFVNDLLAILEELRINRCIYVGHSMSAMVGCLASIEKPQLFRKLVLLCASPRYLNDDDYYGGFQHEDIVQVYQSMETNFLGWVSGFVPLIIGKSMDTHNVALDKALDTFYSMNSRVALTVAQTIFESDFRSILGKVHTPCHILHTNEDVVAPIEVAQYLHKHLGGESSLEILDTTGHLPHLIAPYLLTTSLMKIFSSP